VDFEEERDDEGVTERWVDELLVGIEGGEAPPLPPAPILDESSLLRVPPLNMAFTSSQA
jgi:hypothetical protein